MYASHDKKYSVKKVPQPNKNFVPHRCLVMVYYSSGAAVANFLWMCGSTKSTFRLNVFFFFYFNFWLVHLVLNVFLTVAIFQYLVLPICLLVYKYEGHGGVLRYKWLIQTFGRKMSLSYFDIGLNAFKVYKIFSFDFDVMKQHSRYVILTLKEFFFYYIVPECYQFSSEILSDIGSHIFKYIHNIHIKTIDFCSFLPVFAMAFSPFKL